MNKYVKVILILVCVLFGIGIIATIGAVAMGVTLDDLDNVGSIRVGERDYNVSLKSPEEKKVSSGALSFEGVEKISIESGIAMIRVSYAPVEKTEVHYDTAVGMSAYMDENELEIECGLGLSSKGTVEILIPEESGLREIDLDVGAGQVLIEDINFRHLDADVGAGELIIEAPDEDSLYDYEIECGIGEIVIGDERYSGITNTQRRKGGGKYLDIDCGAGRVEIRFEK